MRSRRRYLRNLASAAVFLGAVPVQASAGHEGDLHLTLPSDLLDEYGYVSYNPGSDLLDSGEQFSADGDDRFRSYFFRKESLSEEINDKSNGEVTHPGAVFFAQVLEGEWAGKWAIESGPDSKRIINSINNTNRVDIQINILSASVDIESILSPVTNIQNNEQTVENQTIVKGDSADSESVVPERARGHVISSFEQLLSDSGGVRPRFVEGLWRELVSVRIFGREGAGHSDEVSSYSKAGYSTAGRTYNAEWEETTDWGESFDDDVFEHEVNVRGYLSIETVGSNEYLGVGGIYVNEEEIEFGEGLLTGSETVELEPDSLQRELLELMQQTHL